MSDLPSREAVAIDLALTESARGRTLIPLYDIIEIGRAYVSGQLVDREAPDYEAVGRVLFEQSMSGSDITSAELEELWQEVREATIEEARAIVDAALTGVVD